jgi:hypothetical protein
MRTAGPELGHQVSYERETKETAFKGWSERVPTPNARASCTCGQLDTGFVEAEQATAAAREHVSLYLPGTPFDGAGPVRPGEEPTT